MAEDNLEIEQGVEDFMEGNDTSNVDTLTPQMARMLREIETLKKQNAGMESKANKIDKIEAAFRDDVVDNDAKFYEDLAANPKTAIKKLVEDETKSIKEERQAEKLINSDERAFSKLGGQDPEFGEVWANLNKFVSQEEIDSVMDRPNRVEIMYGLAKSRKVLQDIKNKPNAREAERIAKEELNRMSGSETPTLGSGAVNDEPKNEQATQLAEYRDKFETKKAARVATDVLWGLTQWGKRFK